MTTPATANLRIPDAEEYGIIPLSERAPDGALLLSLPDHFDPADGIDLAILLGIASDHLGVPFMLIDLRYTLAPDGSTAAVVGPRGTLGHHLDTVAIRHTGPSPTRAHATDGGWDVRSTENVLVPAGDRAMVGTGLRVAIPAGHRIDVRPRSGLAAKNGVTVLNTPGLIDAGYTGEIKVVLSNTSDTDFEVTEGMRIAQLVIERVVDAAFLPVEAIVDGERGAAGFGSTGR
ncbi:hypothetical protein GCM10011374_36320 [Kocuria dechangensis]|uniref:dUTP diphosphatase n=1 Tax=Kocuria dechangensis TaxID=1176249 RepID=A0A917H738_9MICC|nr:dUTP diphosphatase [Kocuria dechangensis]GGG68657.1 hypothetical protein GCM10011374_36320 [Kocuria dechangensis]